MTTQKLLTIGLIALVITALIVVGGVLFKGQDTILSTSSVPSTTTEASSGGYEIINGISVPPEPDPAVNNATLAGVDSNANGVRDDVERFLAKESKTAEEFFNVSSIARSYQSMLLAPELNQPKFDELDKVVMCADIAASDYLNAVHILPEQFNTAARKETYKNQTKDLSGRFYFPRQECGNNDSQIRETINGIAVPPEPDPVVNNATLAGVDVNTNGVRDDVERMIVKRYGADEKARNAGMLSARARQQLLVADKTNRDGAINALKSSGAAGLCAGNAFDAAGRNSTEELAYTYAWTYNTEARLDAKASISARAGSYSQTVTSIVCPQFSESETINGITVPPEPDPAINNATLAGVDSNANGVRDDVERVLARKAPNVGDFNDLIKYFAAYQRITTDPTPNNREAAVAQYRAITCSLGKGVPITHLANLMRQNEIDTLALVFNTSERIAKRTATGKMLDGGYDGEELLCE